MNDQVLMNMIKFWSKDLEIQSLVEARRARCGGKSRRGETLNFFFSEVEVEVTYKR